ncbi:MAG: glutamate racemase [Thiohalocapsa sp.]|nr:glutamate racemase [Thiohalocapsa sp.]MCF7992300.1 glutamate racemase [Thiohalocapsa sp.]
MQTIPASCERPIGVFDSGVGGLSVLAEIRRALPCEDLLYVADSGFAPYGDKPAAIIEARTHAIADFLIARRAKAIVIACNTATGAAARALRARIDLPVIAMEPAIKPALALTRTGVVGVLATSQTLASHNFVELMGRFAAGANVLVQPCPGLVELVEAGRLDDEATRARVADYVVPLLERGADTLVLGCTHYPHLRPLIADIAGPDIAITDSGAAVARQVHRRLAELGLLASRRGGGTARFWTSAEPAAAAGLIARLWAHGVTVSQLPSFPAAAR